MKRWTLFTDDELYALLNALTFAVPTFDSHCEKTQQWAGEWKVKRTIRLRTRQTRSSNHRRRTGNMFFCSLWGE